MPVGSPAIAEQAPSADRRHLKGQAVAALRETRLVLEDDP